MNILFIGDIFGKTGRKMIATYLPKIVEKYSVECVIANGENTSHGKGLLQKHYDELLTYGISLITMGNHTYSKKEIFDYIDEADHLIVPLNKPLAMPGVGSRVIEVKGKKIRVTNLLGLTFMDGKPQNPFEAIEPVLENDSSDIHIIDFHGEATSEKIAFANYFDGRINIVVGTHTHVQTNDARILPKGTMYMTDLGMTGPLDGIIGVNPTPIIKRFLTGMPVRHIPMETGPKQLNGLIVEINELTHKTTNFEIVNVVKY